MERGPFWRAGLLPESPWEAHPVTIIANLGEPIGESRLKNVQVLAIADSLGGNLDAPIDLRLSTAVSQGADWLARENAALLVWGEINETGNAIYLRFVSHARDDDHPGTFLMSDKLPLPIETADEYSDLLSAVALAAIVPRTETQRSMIRALLAAAFESVQETAHEPPIELSFTDQASIQVCYANVAALLGHHGSDPNGLRRAAQIYQDTVESLSHDETPLDWATTQRHLGLVRQNTG